ncbi:hypothetical protein [Clostridium sp. DL1XJH146]
MKILICIDDTDNIESKGTGELAQMIAEYIEEAKWAKCSKITRHQLFIHEDIPYTSHNSSMCFEAKINDDFYDEIKDYAINFLKSESAEGSDPGLAILKLNEYENYSRLMEYGKRAKEEVILKEEAYSLAKEMHIHLSEHGGTGIGVIGALAGIGLRLTGNDGRFKGQHKFKVEKEILTVTEILENKDIDEVREINKEKLDEKELVQLSKKVKTVFIDNKSVLLVCRENEKDEKWSMCSRAMLRKY